jgi:hypothetical protein
MEIDSSSKKKSFARWVVRQRVPKLPYEVTGAKRRSGPASIRKVGYFLDPFRKSIVLTSNIVAAHLLFLDAH